MKDLSFTYVRSSSNPDKESANRKLKRLRILLLIWLLCFLATIIWFTLSPL